MVGDIGQVVLGGAARTPLFATAGMAVRRFVRVWHHEAGGHTRRGRVTNAIVFIAACAHSARDRARFDQKNSAPEPNHPAANQIDGAMLPALVRNAMFGPPEYQDTINKVEKRSIVGGKPGTGGIDGQLMEQRSEYRAFFGALDITLGLQDEIA